MGNLSLDLNQFRSAGVYTVEYDNTRRNIINSQSLRLVVGFSDIGPQNVPVYISNEQDLYKFYGPINPKLERKGSFFHRSILACLETAPVMAISLLNCKDESGTGYGANPVSGVSYSLNVNPATKTVSGSDPVPVDVKISHDTLSYQELFNRSRFWKPSGENLLDEIVSKTADIESIESAPFISFSNVGTKKVSLFVTKVSALPGMEVRVKDWYINESDIPYEWMSPNAFIKDYFIRVVAVDGDWSLSKKLHLDPTYSKYFNENGLKANMINSFLTSGVKVVGNWVGTYIPNFVDNMNTSHDIQNIVNSYTHLTGVLMNINHDAIDFYGENGVCVIDPIGASLDFTKETQAINFLSYVDTINTADFTADVNITELSTTNKITVDNADDLKIGDYILCGTESNKRIGVVLEKIMIEVQTQTPTGRSRTLTNTITTKYEIEVSDVPLVKTTTGGEPETTKYSVKKISPIVDSVSTISVDCLSGFAITNKNLPGYDSKGMPNVELGLDKIYSMLSETGINRGLLNRDMISYRYIVDTMAYGLQPMLGGKVHLSKLAKKRGKTTALLNAPAIKQFIKSQNPSFRDVVVGGKGEFDTKWIGEGGNPEAGRSFKFTLPNEENGGKYCGAFGPFLEVVDNTGNVFMPPAAYVSNAFIRKFMGGNPHAIVANKNGLLSSAKILNVEYALDQFDRDFLEPFGYNSIIDNGGIMIYSNCTSDQTTKSDLSFLHTRETLNTIEIETEDALKPYVFDDNIPTTRVNILETINPIMKKFKDAGAITDYQIQMDTENNSDELINDGFAILDIIVWVAKGMQKIINRISINKNNGTTTGGFTY